MNNPRDDKPVDLRKLAEQAAQEAYSPRAKHCWPWSHRWTMWEAQGSGRYFQNRRCLRCGLTVEKDI